MPELLRSQQAVIDFVAAAHRRRIRTGLPRLEAEASILAVYELERGVEVAGVAVCFYCRGAGRGEDGICRSCNGAGQ